MTEALRLQTTHLAPRRFRVSGTWPEMPGVTTLTLAPEEPGDISFRPGQFNMLYAFGIGEIAISISGNPDADGDLVHTVRAVGAVSTAITRLGRGAMIGLRGPFGSAWPVEQQAGRDLVFVAGGLGLAPMRPAILWALARRERFGSVTIVVGARAPSDLLFAAQLAAWAEADGTRVMVTVDHASPGWTGMVGVVTARLGAALRGRDPARVSAFVCGPEIMMRHTCQELEDAGVSADRQWISMERNMKCAVGTCGHCQFGQDFVCRDGPVFPWSAVSGRLRVREL